jgi:hypothetical protein
MEGGVAWARSPVVCGRRKGELREPGKAAVEPEPGEDAEEEEEGWKVKGVAELARRCVRVDPLLKEVREERPDERGVGEAVEPAKCESGGGEYVGPVPFEFVEAKEEPEGKDARARGSSGSTDSLPLSEEEEPVELSFLSL